MRKSYRFFLHHSSENITAETGGLQAKKELALACVRLLKEAYPDTVCTLDYDEAWKLLVSVRL
ncbi:MAG: hypothetical protein IKD69_12460, partial [Solobacterium sp.]|nr:hypothetical protein [Solobacterium sp.]